MEENDAGILQSLNAKELPKEKKKVFPKKLFLIFFIPIIFHLCLGILFEPFSIFWCFVYILCIFFSKFKFKKPKLKQKKLNFLWGNFAMEALVNKLSISVPICTFYIQLT